MVNKDIISNYNYGLIINNKYNFFYNLSNLVNIYNGEFKVQLISIIALYCIDLNNIDKELYSDKETSLILKLLQMYDKNISTITIKSEDLKKILDNCKYKRVSFDLNKKIAIKIANYINEVYGINDIANSVDIDMLSKTLDKLKD